MQLQQKISQLQGGDVIPNGADNEVGEYLSAEARQIQAQRLQRQLEKLQRNTQLQAISTGKLPSSHQTAMMMQ
ncbi:hypothetical protein, partial [Pseudomonas aeruginosa]|uniref:hypothetical protein n=1 Tax=Pseudomonas aeruginosa TaxID=287 RepID=UPI0013CE0643